MDCLYYFGAIVSFAEREWIVARGRGYMRSSCHRKGFF